LRTLRENIVDAEFTVEEPKTRTDKLADIISHNDSRQPESEPIINKEPELEPSSEPFLPTIRKTVIEEEPVRRGRPSKEGKLDLL